MASLPRTANNGKHAPNPMTTALLYTRVSKDEMAREALSLDAQLEDCRRYAAQPCWALGEEYQDVLSGKRDDRPQYQQLLADLRRLSSDGEHVVVVVKWLHRLGRRVLERVRCREEMKALGVPLYSIAEGGEVSDLVANILASVAEEEVRQLGERVQAVNRHLARTGWARPGRATWGYRWRTPTEEERANGSPKAVLVTDPETAPFVQEAYRKVANGLTVRGVQRWIASLPDRARGGRGVTHRTVQQILTSPTYIAFSRVDDALLQGRWPALIDRGIWDRVQSRISDHKHMPHQASRRYLLTGLLRCPSCGARMQGTPNRVGHVRPLYRCHGYIDGHRIAIQKNCGYSVRQKTVDVAVLDQVSLLVETITIHDSSFRDDLRRAWSTLQQPEARAEVAHRLQQLERARNQAQDRLRKAAILFVDGALDRSGYDLARAAAQADLEAAQSEIEQTGGGEPTIVLPPFDDVLRELGGWSSVLGAEDVAAKRDVLGLLIDRIVPVRIGYGKYDAQISWTPLGDALHHLITTGIGARS